MIFGSSRNFFLSQNANVAKKLLLLQATGGPAPTDAAAVAALMAAHATMPPGVSAGVAFRSTLPSTGGGLVIPPGTTCKAYRAKPPPPPSASILAAATGAPDHTHTLLGGPWPTAVTAAAEAMREASASPSPCPSSPASSIYTAQPLMTASSDEFVSDQRVPVQVSTLLLETLINRVLSS